MYPVFNFSKSLTYKSIKWSLIFFLLFSIFYFIIRLIFDFPIRYTREILQKTDLKGAINDYINAYPVSIFLIAFLFITIRIYYKDKKNNEV